MNFWESPARINVSVHHNKFLGVTSKNKCKCSTQHPAKKGEASTPAQELKITENARKLFDFQTITYDSIKSISALSRWEYDKSFNFRNISTVNATHNPNNIVKIEPSLKSSQDCFTTPCQLANLNNNNKVGPNLKSSQDCFTTASQFANPNNIVKIEPSLKSSQDCFTTACQSVIPNSTTKVETNAKNSKGNYKTFSKLAILQTPSSSLEEITSQFSSEIYTVNYLVPATGFNPSNNTETLANIVQFIDIKIGTLNQNIADITFKLPESANLAGHMSQCWSFYLFVNSFDMSVYFRLVP